MAAKQNWSINILEPKLFIDDRGMLGEIDFRNLDFNPKRIYWVDFSRNLVRGKHAHKKLTQVLVVLRGSIEIHLNDTIKVSKFVLKTGDNILIKPGVWREFQSLLPESTCLVIASEYFDEDDYIRDFEEYVRYRELL